MANSSIPIAGSSGGPYSVDTETQAGGDHRQVFVIGDPTSAAEAGVDSFGRLATAFNDADIVAGPTTITATDAVVAAPAGTGATVSGASTAGSLVSIACPGGDSAWNVQLTGVTTGTFWFEGSLDSTNGTDGTWINVNGRQTGIINTVLVGGATTNGIFRGNTSGLKYFRVRQTGTYTATPSVTIRISGGVGAVFLNASIPAGANNIGGVSIPATTAAGAITTQNLVPAGVATAASAVELTVDEAGTLGVQVTGTYTGALSLQATVDGTTWVTVGGTPFLNMSTGALSATIASATPGVYQAEVSAFLKVRVTGLAAMTGTATVTLIATLATGVVSIDTALPVGTNVIGKVGIDQSTPGTTNLVMANAPLFRISVASAGLTIATTAYLAGDQLGTIFTLPNAALVAGGFGRIRAVNVQVKADITGAMDVIFYRATTTLAADNAVASIAAADVLNVVDVVQLGSSVDLGLGRVARATGLDIPYDCTGTSLFASITTRIGHTFFAAVGDIQLVVFVERY